MKINEAIKKALETDGMITRSKEDMKAAAWFSIGVIKPEKSGPCTPYTLRNGTIYKEEKQWSPTEDDLTADDWELLPSVAVQNEDTSMTMHEAAAKALKTGGLIKRNAMGWGDTSNRFFAIKLGNSNDKCKMLQIKDKKIIDCHRKWNPKAADLTATDWEVLEQIIIKQNHV